VFKDVQLNKMSLEKATRHVIPGFGFEKAEEVAIEASLARLEVYTEDETFEEYLKRQDDDEDKLIIKAFDTIFQTLPIKNQFKHGDIADFGDGYKNNACFIFNGTSLVSLDYSIDEYGNIPESFLCLEEPFHRNPEYWTDVIKNNHVIHINPLRLNFHSFINKNSPLFSMDNNVGIIVHSEFMNYVNPATALSYIDHSIVSCSGDSSLFDNDPYLLSLGFDYILVKVIEDKIDTSLIMDENGWGKINAANL
jgi:hypothetical protein